MGTLSLGWTALTATAWMAAGACGGGIDPERAPDGGAENHIDGGGSTGQGDFTTIPASFTSAQVQTALATCNEPHGNVVTIGTDADELANLPGAWLLCPSAAEAGASTMFAPGIVIEPDATFESLRFDGDGGLLGATGVQTQGKWTVVCEDSSDIQGSQPCSNVTVRLQAVGGDLSPAGCFGGNITYESSPRRMYTVDEPGEWCDSNLGNVQLDLWLVPLL